MPKKKKGKGGDDAGSEAPEDLGLPVGDVSGNALIGISGDILTKHEEQYFANCDRELMLMHFKAANEKIVLLEMERVQKQADNQELKATLEKEKANQEDIFEYLRGEIHNKNNHINELQDKNLTLMEEQERMTQENERTQQQLIDKASEEKVMLQQEVRDVRAELKKVETFIKKENELEIELADKVKQIEDDRKAHADKISDLERKHVQEKDRLKKEMLLKLRETKANLLKMTDNQLDTTTKRTIAENEQMSTELAWQSKETEKLIKKNDKVMGENANLRRELSLHKQTQEEFARKVNVYQKTIKTLLAKLNDLDAKQQAELMRMQLEDDEKDREKAEGLRERESLEVGLTDTAARLQAAHEEVSRMRTLLQEMEEKHANVLSLQDEAVKFTLQCLLDVQAHESSRRYARGDEFGGRDPDEPLSLQTLDPNKREEVMDYILEQLRAYQEQLRELELHNAWKQHTAEQPRDGVQLPRIPGAGPVWAAPPPPNSSAFFGDPRHGDDVVIGVGQPLRDARVYGKRSKLPTRL